MFASIEDWIFLTLKSLLNIFTFLPPNPRVGKKPHPVSLCANTLLFLALLSLICQRDGGPHLNFFSKISANTSHSTFAFPGLFLKLERCGLKKKSFLDFCRRDKTISLPTLLIKRSAFSKFT